MSRNSISTRITELIAKTRPLHGETDASTLRPSEQLQQLGWQFAQNTLLVCMLKRS